MDINELIRRRRAIYPKNYLPEKPVSREILEQLLENANWAPTHKLTEPWRFRVFHSENARRQLGAYLSEYYRQNTPASCAVVAGKINMECPLVHNQLCTASRNVARSQYKSSQTRRNCVSVINGDPAHHGNRDNNQSPRRA